MPKTSSSKIPSEITIQTHRNWKMIVLMIPILGFFILLPSVGVGFGSWILNIVFGLSIFGCFMILHTAITGGKKKLRFSVKRGVLSVRDFPRTDDKDFNKTFPLSKIQNFVHSQAVDMVAALPLIEDALCIIDTEKKVHVFVDLSLPEVAIYDHDVALVLGFVQDHLRRK